MYTAPVHSLAFKKSMAVLSRFSASLEALEIAVVLNLDLPDSLAPVNSMWDGFIHGPCVLRLTDQAIAELGAAMSSDAKHHT